MLAEPRELQIIDRPSAALREARLITAVNPNGRPSHPRRHPTTTTPAPTAAESRSTQHCVLRKQSLKQRVNWEEEGLRRPPIISGFASAKQRSDSERHELEVIL